MLTFRMNVTIPESRQMTIRLPDEVATGEAELAISPRTGGNRPDMPAFWRNLDRIIATPRNTRPCEELDAELAAERAGWE